jgi:hypothetical protein
LFSSLLVADVPDRCLTPAEKKGLGGNGSRTYSVDETKPFRFIEMTSWEVWRR